MRKRNLAIIVFIIIGLLLILIVYFISEKRIETLQYKVDKQPPVTCVNLFRKLN